MEQARRLVECDECGGIAVVTPVTDEDIKFCGFCGHELESGDE
jgi:hypothetical protein